MFKAFAHVPVHTFTLSDICHFPPWITCGGLPDVLEVSASLQLSIPKIITCADLGNALQTTV